MLGSDCSEMIVNVPTIEEIFDLSDLSFRVKWYNVDKLKMMCFVYATTPYLDQTLSLIQDRDRFS